MAGNGRMKSPNISSAGPGCRETKSIFLRSLALQASWNPLRMQHMGLLAALIPWVRRLDMGKKEVRRFCRDHYGYFNTNPYLANYLIGGLIRLEENRRNGENIDQKRIVLFKETLGRALASLGDQLFWLGLQPAILMIGVLFAFAGLPAGVLAPVALFSVWQLVLRYRAIGDGYRLGIDIVDLLSSPVWHRAIHTLKRVGAVLTGVCAAWVVYGTGELVVTDNGHGAALGLVMTAGLALWARRRLPGEAVVLLLVPLALALSYL